MASFVGIKKKKGKSDKFNAVLYQVHIPGLFSTAIEAAHRVYELSISFDATYHYIDNKWSPRDGSIPGKTAKLAMEDFSTLQASLWHDDVNSRMMNGEMLVASKYLYKNLGIDRGLVIVQEQRMMHTGV